MSDDPLEKMLDQARIPTSDRTWQDVTDGLNRLREDAPRGEG